MELLPGDEQWAAGAYILTCQYLTQSYSSCCRTAAGKMKGVLCNKGNLTYSSDVPPPKLTDGQVLIDVKATGGGFHGSPLCASGVC